ncbi:TPA: hypothetical protein NDY26_005192 [Enterobacter hormaechei]|nr:hypothetical protein [Enterobacter hormaechei]
MNIPKKMRETPFSTRERRLLSRSDINAKKSPPNKKSHAVSRLVYRVILQPIIIKKKEIMNV